MVPEDIRDYVERLRSRHAELEKQLGDPEIYSKVNEFKLINQEHRKLSTLFHHFDAWVKALDDLSGSRELMAAENDPEMRELAAAEIEELEKSSTDLEEQLQLLLLPPDPNDSKNIIVGIKPAAGGDEAALFAGELFRAYLYFAEKQGWKVEILDQTDTDLSLRRRSLQSDEIRKRRSPGTACSGNRIRRQSSHIDHHRGSHARSGRGGNRCKTGRSAF